MRSSHPSNITVRSDKVMTLIYDFVDTSGSSFGSTLYWKGKSIIILVPGVVVNIQTLQIGESSKILCLRLKRRQTGMVNRN